MSPLGSISSLLQTTPLQRPDSVVMPRGVTDTSSTSRSVPTDGFNKMLDGLVNQVQAKETAADQVTQKVLMGDGGQLHQSMIAMQEASVAFSLMVEVRNKVVESYQELMRMQV